MSSSVPSFTSSDRVFGRTQHSVCERVKRASLSHFDPVVSASVAFAAVSAFLLATAGVAGGCSSLCEQARRCEQRLQLVQQLGDGLKTGIMYPNLM